MSKFIVTGANGFIGSNLCRKLLQLNHDVYAICRENSNLSNLDDICNNINILKYNGDIDCLINFFKQVNPDCVFHLASYIAHDHNKDDISNLINSNIYFGCQILEAMSRCNISNIVNTSTYWQHYKNRDYDPVCLYSATKEAFEKLLIFYINAYSLKAITLKLFDTYGENDSRNKLINNLRQLAISNQELKLSEGYQKIDLTHVDDICNAYIVAFNNLCSNDYKGHTSYAVCSNRLVNLRELISIFEKENNLKLNVSFGEKPYRFREVMNPWSNYTILPNWKCTISLEEGVKRIGKYT